MRSLGMGRALKPWLLVMLAQKQELFGCIRSLLCGIIPCLLPIEQANKAFTPKRSVQFQDGSSFVTVVDCSKSNAQFVMKQPKETKSRNLQPSDNNTIIAGRYGERESSLSTSV